MNLREYQINPVKKGIEFFNSKDSKPSLLVLPTAAGKSIIIAFIAKEIKDKTIILQPSKELLEQNYEKFSLIEGNASIYSASKSIKEFGDITYATIGSIKNIGKEFKQLGYKNLIVDEAHLYPRGSESMFGKFLKDSEIKNVLGLSATPFKLQTNSFAMQKYSILKMLTSVSKHGNLFKDIIHITQIQELTNLNYWSKLEYELYDVDNGDLIFNSTQAEFTEESIEKFYKNQNIEQKIINKIENCNRNKILVFVPSINDAINLSQKVENSAAVYGDMPKIDREQIINNFKNGNLKVIFNVNVLSVGFDYPEIDCIICGRPTASLAWMYQAFGRGTRIHPNKENCLIVDFTNNTNTFGKIEDLYFEKEDKTWKLYGSGKRLLTGIAISDIKPLIPGQEKEILFTFGKHIGKKVSEVPDSYLNWLLKDFTFNERTLALREEILRVKSARTNTLKSNVHNLLQSYGAEGLIIGKEQINFKE